MKSGDKVRLVSTPGAQYVPGATALVVQVYGNGYVRLYDEDTGFLWIVPPERVEAVPRGTALCTDASRIRREGVEMHSTAYLILFVDAEGVIVDAQVASEYPVTQMLDGRTQALINQRSGVSYDHACVSLLDYAALNVSWVFKHKRLRKQAEDMMRFADSKDRSIRCAKDWHNVRRVLQG